MRHLTCVGSPLAHGLVCSNRQRQLESGQRRWSRHGSRKTQAAFHTYEPSQSVIRKVVLDTGEVTIRPLEKPDIGGAAVLLTRCFGHTDGRNISEIRQYVTEMLDCPPDGVFLVACLIPTDKAKLPRNRSFLIAGLAAVSFNSATREQMPTLQPPDTAAYLSNIAVAPQFRRMGLASALMQAAEEVSREAKLHSLYLHARVKDLEAQSFYTKMRYSPAGRDSRFAAVWHHAVQRVMFYKDL